MKLIKRSHLEMSDLTCVNVISNIQESNKKNE